MALSANFNLLFGNSANPWLCLCTMHICRFGVGLGFSIYFNVKDLFSYCIMNPVGRFCSECFSYRVAFYSIRFFFHFLQPPHSRTHFPISVEMFLFSFFSFFFLQMEFQLSFSILSTVVPFVWIYVNGHVYSNARAEFQKCLMRPYIILLIV